MDLERRIVQVIHASIYIPYCVHSACWVGRYCNTSHDSWVMGEQHTHIYLQCMHACTHTYTQHTYIHTYIHSFMYLYITVWLYNTGWHAAFHVFTKDFLRVHVEHRSVRITACVQGIVSNWSKCAWLCCIHLLRFCLTSCFKSYAVFLVTHENNAVNISFPFIVVGFIM